MGTVLLNSQGDIITEAQQNRVEASFPSAQQSNADRRRHATRAKPKLASGAREEHVPSLTDLLQRTFPRAGNTSRSKACFDFK